jgi:hypothetical protein
MADTNESGLEIGCQKECLKFIDTYASNVAIVWLSDSLSMKNKSSITPLNDELELNIGLATIQQHIYKCNDMRTCIKRLEKLADKNVIVLISEDRSLANEHKLKLCSFPHVQCVYQFGAEEPCLKSSALFNYDNKLLENESCLINIPSNITTTSLKNLGRRTKIFALKLFLLEILQQTSCTPKEKEDFINVCLSKCVDEKGQQAIHQYDKTPAEKKAIWWYTGDRIIPFILNQILREENPNSIIRLHYFIHELYSELNELYLSQRSERKFNKQQLYRGKVLSSNQLLRLQKSEGTYVVTDSFVSTTTDEQVARIFAGYENCQRSNTLSVIFFMKFHVKENISKPIAFIGGYSQKYDENEVLLSAGIVMRIASVTKRDVCV